MADTVSINGIPLMIGSQSIANNAVTLPKLSNDVSSRLLGSQFSGKNIVCVTDSWGSEGVYNVTTAWMHLLCNMLNANYIDLHQGSTGFIAAPSFQTRLQTWVSSHSDLLASVDYVFVCGSPNDYASSRATITNAMSQFIDYATANLPNATVVLFGQPFGADPFKFSVGNVASPWSAPTYAADYLMATMPNKQRCVYVPDTYYALSCQSNVVSQLMNADNIHPTQKGHNIIARIAYQALTSRAPTKILQQKPVIYLGETITEMTTPVSTSYSFASLGIDNNVMSGVYYTRFTVPSTYTPSASTRIGILIPNIMPVGQLGLNGECMGDGFIYNGTIAQPVQIARLKNWWELLSNAQDDATNIYMGLTQTMALQQNVTYTLALQFHLNMCIYGGIY